MLRIGQGLDVHAFTDGESVIQVHDEFDDEETIAQDTHKTYAVQPCDVGVRLDKLAAAIFSDFSRASLQKMIEDGTLTVNDEKVKPKYSIKANDVIVLSACDVQTLQDLPEDIALDVIYEDETVLVINKPVGLVVHPGAGNRTGTLVNGLLWHYPNLAALPRAGLVHRIDKDTSGLLIVAKTAQAQLNLINQLKDKSVYREYICVVTGDYQTLCVNRSIDLPIARHSAQRTKMAVKHSGKHAITHLKTITPLVGNCHQLNVMLETGRTHQIRVHLSHIGCPLVGDGVYGKPTKVHPELSAAQLSAIKNFSRQALHAHTLGFIHPTKNEQIIVSAPMPQDMTDLIELLQS